MTSDDALRELRSVLGSDQVLSSQDDLSEWRDPFQYATWDEYVAAAVVMPESVEEVAGHRLGQRRRQHA